jgi:hypothetical protein
MTALKHLAILPRSAAKWLGRRLSAKQLLTKNEARRIAVNVAKAAGGHFERVETRQALDAVFHIEIDWEALPKTVIAITSGSFRF